MESVIIAVGAFVPMLLILVVIHELGHFFTARAFGIKVLEFGVGYPPRAFGFYTGKTQTRIDEHTRFVNLTGPADLRPGQLLRVSSTEDARGNLVARVIELKTSTRSAKPEPVAGQNKGFGLFSQAADEATPSDALLKHEGKLRAINGDTLVLADLLYSVNWTPLGGFVRLAGESDPAVPRSLASKKPGLRFLVLLAGPGMNFLLPILLFAALFMVPQEVTVGNVRIDEVTPGSPAAAAGAQPGDLILEANGRPIETQNDLIRQTNLNLGSEVEWQILRDGETRTVRLTPRVNPPEGQGATGIRIELINERVEKRSDPPWTALAKGATNTWQMLVLLKQEVTRWVLGQQAPQLSGPIGIAQVTGEVTQEGGFSGWLVLLILFSMNLAILNILPIPMLDGGRIFFVLLEWIRGKRVPPEKEGLAHMVGFALLLALILLISVNDIQRLIQGGSVLGG